MESKHTVLVTGFGPFNNHAINASWEAVKELEKICADSKELRNVNLCIREIPVSYKHVSRDVPMLWKEHDPAVVLHVGVSHKAKCLTIEQYAHSCGYDRPDIYSECPHETDVLPCTIETDVNVKKLCDIINQNSNETGCTACISQDAGRYLCEYIYYQSLRIQPKRALFVHVPDFHEYSSVQTAKGLHDILCHMIEDLEDVQK